MLILTLRIVYDILVLTDKERENKEEIKMIIKINAKVNYGSAYLISLNTEDKDLPPVDWSKTRKEMTGEDRRKMNYNYSMKLIHGIAKDYSDVSFEKVEIDGKKGSFEEVLEILEIK